jgi:hypothetical protein
VFDVKSEIAALREDTNARVEVHARERGGGSVARASVGAPPL